MHSCYLLYTTRPAIPYRTAARNLPFLPAFVLCVLPALHAAACCALLHAGTFYTCGLISPPAAAAADFAVLPAAACGCWTGTSRIWRSALFCRALVSELIRTAVTLSAYGTFGRTPVRVYSRWFRLNWYGLHGRPWTVTVGVQRVYSTGRGQRSGVAVVRGTALLFCLLPACMFLGQACSAKTCHKYTIHHIYSSPATGRLYPCLPWRESLPSCKAEGLHQPFSLQNIPAHLLFYTTRHCYFLFSEEGFMDL